METPRENLKRRAEIIFRAGLAAVDPEACVHRHLHLEGDRLMVGDVAYGLNHLGRILVVGIGKAPPPWPARWKRCSATGSRTA